METARLKAFVESADQGSIKAAAEVLGYTPSAISQLVTALEKELGLTLFRRSQKGVTLTEEGEAIIPLVRSYLAEENEIYLFAQELKGVTTGKISIATYSSVATTWLPEVVRRFKADYPGIQINILECIYDDVMRCFERNEADLALMVYTEPMPYKWISLAEQPVVAVIPDDHRLAGAESFPIKECENEDFVIERWGKEHEILDIFNTYDVHPEVKYTTYDTPATLALVRMGLGISFVNELSTRNWNENIVKLPLDPPQNIVFGIAIPSPKHMTGAARKFVDCTLDFFDGGLEQS